jgi:hypothetical protein
MERSELAEVERKYLEKKGGAYPLMLSVGMLHYRHPTFSTLKNSFDRL